MPRGRHGAPSGATRRAGIKESDEGSRSLSQDRRRKAKTAAKAGQGVTQKKAAFVDSIDRGGRHLVLKAPHPSPLSAHSGFFGSRHFSKANAFLESVGQKPIDWRLPENPAAA